MRTASPPTWTRLRSRSAFASAKSSRARSAGVSGRTLRAPPSARVASRKSSCTCPSDADPCKHVEALRETYKVHPASFVDAEPLLAKLAKGSNEEIVQQIREAALRSPSILSALDLVELEDEEFWDD